MPDERSMSLITHCQLKGSGDLPPIMGIAVGSFVVFQDGAGWNITHRGSGLAVKYDCCCPIHAIAVAEAIEPIMDWTTVLSPMRRERTAGIRAVILTTKCLVHAG